MSNPPLLFLDTDVLIQLFLTNTQNILHSFKTEYDISAIIVPEVELELIFTKKFGTQFNSPLRKAVSNGIITVMDSQNFSSIINSNAALQASTVGTSYADIQNLGVSYSRRIHRGEAYTHATAVSLGQPVASNDWNAIKVLQQADLPLPSPVLRTYDLVVFAYETKILSESACETSRKTLLSEKEFIPKMFRTSSFKNGLPNFVPRLVESGSQPAGVVVDCNPSFDTPLRVTRVSQ